jgi:oligopeptidase B
MQRGRHADGAVASRAGMFAGIVAEVPFVDMPTPARRHAAADAANGGMGQPDRRKDFRTISSYSPYENVAAKEYPAVLAMGGLTDPRVTYWEPAKWIARLRATMTGGGPVLLRTNMGAGHGGASGRFNRLDEVAIAFAFALWAVGMADKGTA